MVGRLPSATLTHSSRTLSDYTHASPSCSHAVLLPPSPACIQDVFDERGVFPNPQTGSKSEDRLQNVQVRGGLRSM